MVPGHHCWYEEKIVAAIYKMDNQQGPKIQHMELCSMLCGAGWEGSLGENGYMCMSCWAPSCSTKTVRTLLINYTQTQSHLKKKRKDSGHWGNSDPDNNFEI